MKAKQKIIATIAIFVGLIAAFLGIVVYPLFRGVVEDHREVLSHKQQLLQLQEDKENLAEFGRVEKAHAQMFDQMQYVFVDSDTPIAFFRFLDTAAASFGLRIEKTPGSVQRLQGDQWSSFEVRLAGAGRYPGVMAFLQKIENAPYLIEIKTLSLSQGRGVVGEEGQGEVDFSMSMKVFANE